MGEGIKIRNQKIALVFVFICSWSYLLLAGQGHIKDICVMLTNPRVIVIFWCFRLVYLKMRDYLSVFPNFYYVPLLQNFMWQVEHFPQKQLLSCLSCEGCVDAVFFSVSSGLVSAPCYFHKLMRTPRAFAYMGYLDIHCILN